MSNYGGLGGKIGLDTLVRRRALKKGARDVFRGEGYRSEYHSMPRCDQYDYERGRRFGVMLRSAGVPWDGRARFPVDARHWAYQNAQTLIDELNV